MRALFHLLLWLPVMALAQSRAGDTFVLTSCPRISHVDKAAFNQQYGRTADEAIYMGHLRAAFGNTLEGLVRYEDHSASPVRFRVYHIPSARSTTVELATLASKGTSKELVEKRSELKKLFSDTLAVHGQQRVRVRLSDADLVPNGYTLLWTDSAGQARTSAVPYARDTLILSHAMLGAGAPLLVQVRLRNTALPGTDLATGHIRFSSPAEQEAVRALMCSIHEERPQYTPEERDRLLLQFSTAWFGHTRPSGLAVLRCPH